MNSVNLDTKSANLERESALVEAILYLETEPVDMETLVKISALSKDVVEAVMEKLDERYTAEESGFDLLKISGGFMLSPKKELWNFLKERYGKRNETRMSRAAMETLSIIAYSQPVTRAEIEGIRGVSADNMIRLLLERGLIKETGKKDIPGKPVQYGTTKDFLRFFRINSIADLPKLDETESERFELAR